METLKIFVYGMTGSGKDTVSNYLRDKHGFVKLRIADTIKRIICESYNLSFDELEEQKRINPELRKAHHIVSDILDGFSGKTQSSLNRVMQLINGKALDYQHISFEHTNKIICDVRTKEEMTMLLKAGWVGIFLTRTTEEFKQSGHFTENNAFGNDIIKNLYDYFLKSMYIIDNDNHLDDIMFDMHYKTNGTTDELKHCINKIVMNLFAKNQLVQEKNNDEVNHNKYFYDTSRNR